jgi:glucokinase
MADGSQVLDPKLKALLKRLVECPEGVSLSELQQDLGGISQPTASRLKAQVTHLLGSTQDAPRGERGGRPAERLALDRERCVFIGMDLGHGHARVIALNPYAEAIPTDQLEPSRPDDLLGKVLAKAEFPARPHSRTPTELLNVDEDPKRAFDVAEELVRDHYDVAHADSTDREKTAIAGIGVSIASPVTADGHVHPLASMTALAGKSIRKLVAARFADLGVTEDLVLVENDANAFAYAEAKLGAATEYENFVAAKWSRGIGVGHFVDGHIYRGHDNLAGEIGHLVLVGLSGPKCQQCGRRCVEAAISVRGIERRVGSALNERASTDSKLALELRALGAGLDADWSPSWSQIAFIATTQESDEEEITLRSAPALRELIRAEFHEAARWFGRALAPVVTASNCEALVIGGEFGVAWSQSEESVGDQSRFKLIEAGLHEGLEEACFPPAYEALSVVPAKTRDAAAVLGAALLVREKRLLPYLESKVSSKEG